MSAETLDPKKTPDGAQRAGAKLIALTGHDKGNSYALPQTGRLSIGRGETNDVVVQDTEVSRHHCEIVADGGSYRLRDLGSTNGSFLGAQRVTEAELPPGAKFRVGHTTFVFVAGEEARAAPPPEPAPRESRERTHSPGRRLLVKAAVVVLLVAAAASALAGVVVLVYAMAGSPWPGGVRTIALSSEPPGVEVFVDNGFIGLTPAEIHVTAADPHALRLARQGYQTWRGAIDERTGRNLAVALDPEPTGVLIIRASKPDTEVYLDGRFVGQTGPEQPVRVPGVKFGEHELRLQRPDYLTKQEIIEVARPEVTHYVKLESREEFSLLNLISKDPGSARLYTELGHACMINKRLEKAMEAYKKALELVYGGTDTSQYATRLRGELQKVVVGGEGLFKYGSKDETRAACEKLEDVFLALGTQYPAGKANVTWLLEHYTARNLQEDAARLQKKMLAQDPDNVELFYQVSAQALARNDYEAAIQTLQEAAKKFPEVWGVYYRLGLAYSRRAASDFAEADRQQAISHLERALRLCNSDAYKRNIEYYIRKAKELKVQ